MKKKTNLLKKDPNHVQKVAKDVFGAGVQEVDLLEIKDFREAYLEADRRVHLEDFVAAIEGLGGDRRHFEEDEVFVTGSEEVAVIRDDLIEKIDADLMAQDVQEVTHQMIV